MDKTERANKAAEQHREFLLAQGKYSQEYINKQCSHVYWEELEG
jgi:hypothetical protein